MLRFSASGPFRIVAGAQEAAPAGAEGLGQANSTDILNNGLDINVNEFKLERFSFEHGVTWTRITVPELADTWKRNKPTSVDDAVDRAVGVSTYHRVARNVVKLLQQDVIRGVRV